MTQAQAPAGKALSSKHPPAGKMRASSKAKPSAAKQRERTALVHRWLRYGVQLVFFILAPALFSGAFNGVKYLLTQIGLGQAIEPTSFVVQLAAVLAFTIVFGRFFCGYACAFGTLGDYLYNGFEFLRRRTPLPRPVFPPVLVKILSFGKYVVLALICIACFTGVWASYSSDSPWVAFAAILSGSIEGIGATALVLLALVAVGMVLRERFFCQFLCPLGAVFSLMPVLGASEFTRTRAHCAKSCGRCHEACPVDIWPDADALEHGECISCGRCADVCPMTNVNMVAIEKPSAAAERQVAEDAKAQKVAAKAERAAQAERKIVLGAKAEKAAAKAPEREGAEGEEKTRKSPKAKHAAQAERVALAVEATVAGDATKAIDGEEEKHSEQGGKPEQPEGRVEHAKRSENGGRDVSSGGDGRGENGGRDENEDGAECESSLPARLLARVKNRPAPIARPTRKSRDKWYLLHGSELGYVAAKALLLLALCWLVGAARYLPSFVEIFGFNPLSF